MKLLIVDDMRSFLDLGKTFLRRADCQLLTATTGLEAIKVAESAHPDLILLDIEMPELNGIEATRILQKHPKLKDIPVIIVSSSTKKNEALAAGAKEFLQKPVDEATYLGAILKHIPLKIRKDKRVRLDAPCEYVHEKVTRGAKTKDVSATGLFISTSEQLEIGHKIEVNFPIPLDGGKKEIRTEAIVVRKALDGFGLGFFQLSEGAKLYLEEYIGAQPE